MGDKGSARALTGRQRAVLEAFKAMTVRKGTFPSVREVAAHFSIQVSAAYRHLVALASRGALENRGGGFRLPGASFFPVPILGRAPAGNPREPLEVPEGYMPVPSEMAGGKELFALRVRGDSMTGAGILDSDLVVVARTERARDGDIVVALVEGEATIKKLGRSGGAPALLPANPRYRPIQVKNDTRILGRILGVFRTIGK